MIDILEQTAGRLGNALHGRADPSSACVTLISGSSVPEVLVAFGADPEQSPVDPADVAPEIPAVSVTPVDGGVVAIEDNGFQGSLTEVLHLLSARGRAAVMFWNVVGDTAFHVAEAGVVTGPGDGIIDDLGHDPAILALFEGLGDVDDDSWMDGLYARGVVAAERFTGIRCNIPVADPPQHVHILRTRPADDAAV